MSRSADEFGNAVTVQGINTTHAVDAVEIMVGPKSRAQPVDPRYRGEHRVTSSEGFVRLEKAERGVYLRRADRVQDTKAAGRTPRR